MGLWCHVCWHLRLWVHHWQRYDRGAACPFSHACSNISSGCRYLSSVAAVLTNEDAFSVLMQQKTQGINDYMKSRKLPDAMRKQIRDHFTCVSRVAS